MPTQHIEDEVLDRYAVGNLPLESIPEVEEHLLVCSQCQGRLTELDDFLIHFRKAASQIDGRPLIFDMAPLLMIDIAILPSFGPNSRGH